MNLSFVSTLQRTASSTAVFCIIVFVVPVVILIQSDSLYAEAVYIIPPAADSGAILKYKNVHRSHDVVSKPACDGAMNPYVYVTPVRMLGATGPGSTTLTPIAGINAFAVDNGPSWTVRGQIKTSSNTNIEGPNEVAVIVEVFCCVNENCN